MDIEGVTREIGERLGSRSLAVAESCTGGLVSQAFAATEGSLEWFRGGLVAYQRGSKETLLGIRDAPLVSRAVAEDMAVGAAKLFAADVAVSVTGAAGPAPLDGAEPGCVVVAVCVDGRVSSAEHTFSGTPTDITRKARDAALAELLAHLPR